MPTDRATSGHDGWVAAYSLPALRPLLRREGGALAVLLALGHHADVRGLSSPSARTIMDELSMSEASYTRAIRRLIEHDLIRVRVGAHRGRAAVYELRGIGRFDVVKASRRSSDSTTRAADESPSKLTTIKSEGQTKGRQFCAERSSILRGKVVNSDGTIIRKNETIERDQVNERKSAGLRPADPARPRPANGLTPGADLLRLAGARDWRLPRSARAITRLDRIAELIGIDRAEELIRRALRANPRMRPTGVCRWIEPAAAREGHVGLTDELDRELGPLPEARNSPLPRAAEGPRP